MSQKQGCLFILLSISLAFANDDFKSQMDPSTEHNKAHLKEDLSGIIDKNPEDMNPVELQFHYFRQHDYDNDEKLDGNEIIMSILHHEQQSMETNGGNQAERGFTDEQLISIVEEVLKYQDTDGDGKLDFHEYTTPYNQAKQDQI
uniref:Multiple coagulation factor deficiency protein 2 homolog n=1 Tax=Phallusia mammillata TaxID=59560 RepID=A0A6F9DL96_9ASCI|nr:multiple coagulation factor deficiency protein 2 homolog [Phallusia mammillata]